MNGQTGIGIVEVYDLDPNQPAFLKNLSARGPVRNGDNALIGGIVIGGNKGQKELILRARGPSLPTSLNRIFDPTFSVYNGAGVSQATYDDWTLDPEANQFLNGSYTSFAPINGFEAAAVRRLPIGGHTLVVTPKTDEGIGIVEFFAAD